MSRQEYCIVNLNVIFPLQYIKDFIELELQAHIRESEVNRVQKKIYLDVPWHLQEMYGPTIDLTSFRDPNWKGPRGPEFAKYWVPLADRTRNEILDHCLFLNMIQSKQYKELSMGQTNNQSKVTEIKDVKDLKDISGSIAFYLKQSPTFMTRIHKCHELCVQLFVSPMAPLNLQIPLRRFIIIGSLSESMMLWLFDTFYGPKFWIKAQSNCDLISVESFFPGHVHNLDAYANAELNVVAMIGIYFYLLTYYRNRKDRKDGQGSQGCQNHEGQNSHENQKKINLETWIETIKFGLNTIHKNQQVKSLKKKSNDFLTINGTRVITDYYNQDYKKSLTDALRFRDFDILSRPNIGMSFSRLIDTASLDTVIYDYPKILKTLIEAHNNLKILIDSTSGSAETDEPIILIKGFQSLQHFLTTQTTSSSNTSTSVYNLYKNVNGFTFS